MRAQQAVLTRANVRYSLYPRSAGSWPGYVFTGAPLRLGAGQFGLGYGSGAHAPDEFFIIESRNPRIAGLREAAMGYVDFLYEMATIGQAGASHRNGSRHSARRSRGSGRAVRLAR